jgi:hypothetical protein
MVSSFFRDFMGIEEKMDGSGAVKNFCSGLSGRPQ